MYKIIIIFIIVILVILFLLSSSKHSSSEHKSSSKNNKPITLDSLSLCISPEDAKIIEDKYHKSLDREYEKHVKTLQKLQNQSVSKINAHWLNKQNEYNAVYRQLSNNLHRENNKRLTTEKYHYYIDLHFRSFLLSEIAYYNYSQAKIIRDDLNRDILSLKNGKLKLNQNQKRTLYQQKDAAVAITRDLYDKMIYISNQTGQFRDKIRDECGKKGRDWYSRLEERKRIKRNSY